MFASHRRKGYAARAITLLCNAAREIGIAHCAAHIDPDNLASQKAVANAGFRPESAAEDIECDGSIRIRQVWLRAVATPKTVAAH